MSTKIKEKYARHDGLGDRMKVYESVFSSVVPPRMPIVLRLDGRSFHSYTKGCKRPYDENLIECMNQTAIALCKDIAGAQLAYVQSDEISILINSYKNYNSQIWFDGKVQKIISISASIATATFNKYAVELLNKDGKLTTFDSRIFIVPEHDINNVFLWRQKDCTRNSVQMLARTLYSHKECNNKNNSELQELCFQKGRNWNDEPTSFKRGRCIVKEEYEHNGVMRKRWIVDNEIPIFSENKDYIMNFFNKDICDDDNDSSK